MSKVILHIGLPKTGTTYLQEWLKLNSFVLEKYGRKVVPTLLAHRIAVEAINGETAKRRDISGILSHLALKDALLEANHDGAIISSEYFFIACPERVAQVLAQYGISISRTIAYLRRQDYLCAAGYAQDIKMLGGSDIPDNVTYTDKLDWNLLESRWKAVSNEVIFVNYDLHKGNLSQSFLEAINLPDAPTSELTEQFNISLTAEMTEIARLLNQIKFRYDVDRLSSIEGWYPNIPFGFSTEMTSEFERLYLESNKEFAARHPDEFGSYALEGWKPLGQNMAGRIGEDHLADVMRYLGRPPIASLPRLYRLPVWKILRRICAASRPKRRIARLRAGFWRWR